MLHSMLSRPGNNLGRCGKPRLLFVALAGVRWAELNGERLTELSVIYDQIMASGTLVIQMVE